MDGGDHRAACRQGLIDQGIADPLRVVAGARGDQDQDRLLVHRGQFCRVDLGRSNQTVPASSPMAPRIRPPITSDSRSTSRYRRSNETSRMLTIAAATAMARTRGEVDSLRMTNASSP